jgi:type I restriction enzyme S subunit
MSKQKNVPELRFPEFTESLSFKYLGEILDFKNGINADKSQYGRGKKFINVLDIINNAPIYHHTIIGSVDITDKEFEKNDVQYGDILFQRSSEIREESGQSNIYLDKNQKATFGGFVIRGRPKLNFDPIYFNYLLKTDFVRKEITDRSGGSTRFNVGQDTLGSVPVLICNSSEEQKKIASFLSEVDRNFTQLRRKKELLETYKRGLMQKIFSQQIRFKQGDGTDFPNWQEKKLGELGIFKSGVGFPESEQSGKEGVPFYKVSDMNLKGNEKFMNSANNYVNKEQITRLKFKPINEPAIIFAKVGAAIFLERKRLSKNFLLDNNMMAFVPLKNFSLKFIFILFNQVRLSKYAQVGALPSYNSSDIASIKVNIPTLEEQQKIVDFLTALDRKIEVVAQQIHHIEQFKKGLLQKMFV